MGKHIVLYSHDSVGLGHVTRNLVIAHALQAAVPAETGRPVSGLLVAGQSAAVERRVPEGWDWLIVPGLAAGPDGYVPRHLQVGTGRLTSLRGELVRAALEEMEPDLFVVDRHAFGAQGELRNAITRLRSVRPGCRIVLGLREVLDGPEAAAREWAALGGPGIVRGLFDDVWVYGDPGVHDPVASGEVPEALADLVVYTGYLARGRADLSPAGTPPSPWTQPYLLTTVGGGSDGGRLALAATRAPTPAGYRHVVVTGPQMPPADRQAIQREADPRTRVLGDVTHTRDLIRDAAAVVCMGGYNTLCEVMATDIPALVVPRVDRRSEQRIRARSLAVRGIVDTLLPDQASPRAVGAWWRDNAGTRVRRSTVDLDGLARVGQLAAAAVSDGQSQHVLEVPHAR